MGLIEWYILFCVATTIVGATQIYTPVLKKLRKNHINDIVTKAPILGYTIFSIIAFITAPALFIVLVIPSIMDKFINDMYNSIIRNDI